MAHRLRGFGLAATLVLVSCLAVVPKAKSQSTSAYVYVQVGGPSGAVYGYSASSTGLLSAIPGSPFKPGTAIIGGTGSQFFTLGHTLLHSYAVGSNGAIGSQLSQAAIFDYGGSSCGNSTSGDNGAVLDHSGKYIYVLLQGGASGTCEAYQTYSIGNNGNFTFLGDAEENVSNQAPVSGGVGLPSILGNETFAYANMYSGHNSGVIGLQRASSGELQAMQFTETDPTLGGYSSNYSPAAPDASPAGNYVVVNLYPYDSGPPQLGSYTVDAQGNISSTNTSSNMPTAYGTSVKFSHSGSFVADWGGAGKGVQIYNFNGAAPLTLYKTILNGTTIQQVAWDSSNHLYAISQSSNTLYVFTVTSSWVTQDSNYSIGSPVSLVVVNNATSGGGGGACSAPTSDGVNVCSPDEGASVPSPVGISAAATVTGGVYRFELWSGSTKLLSSDNGTLDQSVSLPPGSYHLVFDARNSSGTHEYAYRDITVTGSGGTTCQAPSSNGVNVCSPGENTTVTSPVPINAAATVTGGVYRFELWSGSNKLLSSDTATMDQPLTLAAGNYHLVFDARNSSGTHEYAYRDITVSTGGAAPTQYDAPLLTTTSPEQYHGQVTVDTLGKTTVQVTGEAPNNAYSLQFCPEVNTSYPTPPCFNVVTVSTDGSGNGTASAKFPKSGDWAGDFSLINSSGNTVVQTWLDPAGPSFNTLTYMSTLLPDTKTNGGAVTTKTGQYPLTSGTETISSGTLVVSVKGASPNTQYGVAEFNSPYLDRGSGLTPSLTTDASGNGSVSINPNQGTEGGDIFTVEGGDYSPAGYIGGFAIP